MSTIHVQQIKAHLQNTFGSHMDMSDYATRDPAERDSALLTRSLAAFAVRHLASATPADSGAAVTDGGQDNGIDAIYFDDAERALILVQAKWHHNGRGTIERGDTQKFVTGFKDLINARFDRFNAKVHKRRGHVEKALYSTNSRFVAVIIYSGTESLPVEQQRDVGDLLKEMNDTSDIVTSQILRQGDIHKIIASGSVGAPINLEIGIREWGQTRDPFHAVYGQVAASEIASWYVHHNRLFAPNIRTFLGAGTEVNQSLMETIRSHPERFWYFNNGITVLCSSIKKKAVHGNSRDSGTFECRDVQIVNGAQTVGAIFHASNAYPNEISKANVLVRLIGLENCPEGFSTEVTRATNTQNRIGPRDFVAFDQEQERIQTELRLEGIHYAYKAGDKVHDNASGFNLDEATIAQACSLGDVGVMVLAKRQLGTLWEDITQDPYKKLFHTAVIGSHVWYKVRILRKIDQCLEQESKDRDGRLAMYPIHGNRFVAYMVFDDLRKRHLATPNGHDIASVVALIPQLVKTTVESLIRVADELFPDAYLAVLFKNTPKCKEIARMMREVAARPPKPPNKPAGESTAKTGSESGSLFE